ncbi:MAG: BlaI/MecI/CopY family transcriptional regulator [Actinobacteria bacterium]|nr:BlaI/MecI/CopY family transcriptional regulator [Actinomycetota bacterium]
MKKDSKNRKYSSEIGIGGINSISNLEADIMKIVWEKEEVTVREVHETMLRKEVESRESGFTPYTTVMSTMTTLAEKGILKQNRVGKTYKYTAAVDKGELSRSIIETVADTLLEGATRELIFRFISESENLSTEGIEKLIKKMDGLKK